jgi:hypothetical protein
MSWIKNIMLSFVAILSTLIIIDKLFYKDSNTIKRHVVLREAEPNISLDKYPHDLYMKDVDKNSLQQKKYRFSTNSDGYIIGPGETVDSSQNVDLIFFGGSTTELMFVDEDKRFPYLVSQILKKKSGEVHSLNGGNSGNNSMHSVINLIAKGLNKRPNFVLMMHNVNDLSGLLRTNSYWDTAKGRAIVQSTHVKNSFYEFIKNVKSLAFPNVYSHFVQVFGSPNLFSTDEWSGVEVVKVNTGEVSRSFRKSLKAFISVCRSWGINPVLMTQPNRLNSSDTLIRSMYNLSNLSPLFSYDEYVSMHEKFNYIIRDVGTEEGILVIDLDQHLSDKKEFLYDAVHLNTEGSVEAAKIISRQLIKSFPKLFY